MMSIAAVSLFGHWKAVTQTALQRPTMPKSPGNQGKHRVNKRRATLSNPMFTLVTSVNVKKTNTTYLPSVSVLRRSAFLCTVSAGHPESRAVTSPLCFPAGRRSQPVQGSRTPGTDTEELDCHMPDILQNGKVEFLNTVIGSNASYKCEEGYKLFGSDTRYCLADEKWNGTVPSCNS
ncbi:unnamed protein product [Ranitomeya imitator]|uniref:Sushi domain-containing protein n=1 Tax=Ranitomeya imitator TaxID=111125 RepID=A0ABN9KX10_9NEOB|nr:unnamed protein product [Ranitomeya imitator]